jgi:hypothetical protein
MAPDARGDGDVNERHRHYLDLETLGLPLPDLVHRRSRPNLAAQHVEMLLARSVQPDMPRDVATTGSLPAAVQETWEKLVAALRASDEAQMLRLTTDLIHYLADAHEPLHSTLHYDGVNATQNGVHAAFEVDVVARCLGARPKHVPRLPAGGREEAPAHVAMEALLESHELAATVLAADAGCPWTGTPAQPVCKAAPQRVVRRPELPCVPLEEVARSRLETAAARTVLLLDRAVKEAHAPQ